jgi:nitric oxide dioxygenase
VQASFAKVEAIAAAAAKLFYQRLFELDPEIKLLFKGVKMAEQRTKLMQTLAVVVNGLDRLDEIASAIESLGVRHVEYGVTEDHYDTGGEALLWALEQGLGPDFTPEVSAAWASVYGLLSSVMIGAAEEARAEAVATA